MDNYSPDLRAELQLNLKENFASKLEESGMKDEVISALVEILDNKQPTARDILKAITTISTEAGES